MLAVDVPFIQVSNNKGVIGELPSGDGKSGSGGGGGGGTTVLQFLQRAFDRTYRTTHDFGKDNDHKFHAYPVLNSKLAGIAALSNYTPGSTGCKFTLLDKCPTLLRSAFLEFFDGNTYVSAMSDLRMLSTFFLWHYQRTFLSSLADHFEALYPDSSAISTHRGGSGQLVNWAESLVPADVMPKITAIQHVMMAQIGQDGVLEDLERVENAGTIVTDEVEANLLSMQHSILMQTDVSLTPSYKLRIERIGVLIGTILARKNPDLHLPPLQSSAPVYAVSKRIQILNKGIDLIARELNDSNGIRTSTINQLYTDLAMVCDAGTSVLLLIASAIEQVAVKLSTAPAVADLAGHLLDTLNKWRDDYNRTQPSWVQAQARVQPNMRLPLLPTASPTPEMFMLADIAQRVLVREGLRAFFATIQNPSR